MAEQLTPAQREAEKVAHERAARAEATLIERVTFPAMFEQVTRYGLTPANEKVAMEIVDLADVVCPAVGRALTRLSASAGDGQLSAVKAAADATRRLAGVPQRQLPDQSRPTAFLTDPDVKAAADALVDFQLKQANLGNLLGGTAKKEDEEEEEEKGKKPPMPSAAC